VSGETNSICCCDGGRTWFAIKCPQYTSNPCCPNFCTNAPNRIEFCDAYLLARGIPIPPNPALCYVFEYACCAYMLSGFDPVPCPNPSSPWPQNVGRLIDIYAHGGAPCCRTPSSSLMNVGTMGDVIVPNCGPVLEQTEDPCTERIGYCYDLCDQFGTVSGKEPQFRAEFTLCAELLGVPWDIRCEHGPPDDVHRLTVTVKQKVGACIPCDTRNGVPDPMPCTRPLECPNDTRTHFIVEDTCPDCRPLIFTDCCGGLNPCEFDPNACSGTVNVKRSYQSRACYSVQQKPDDMHVEPVMLLEISDCVPIGYGVNPYDPVALNNFIRDFFVSLTTRTTSTCWGPIDTQRITICSLNIDVVSGNASHIVDRINTRLGSIIKATTFSECFWFGTRQSCTPCPWATISDRPNYLAGDTIEITSVQYSPATSSVRVLFSGRAPRYFACAAMSLNTISADENCRQDASAQGEWVTISRISAEGTYPYTLQGYSVPEFCSGKRYDWVDVEVEETVTDICVAPSTFQTVTSCAATSGYPINDVVVYGPNGEIEEFTFGFSTLCPSMPVSKFGCRCYPYRYQVAPCCPVGYPDCDAWYLLYPLPEPCVNANFQSPTDYCTTLAKFTPVSGITYC